MSPPQEPGCHAGVSHVAFHYVFSFAAVRLSVLSTMAPKLGPTRHLVSCPANKFA